MSEISGLNEACGVFACVASGPYPRSHDIASTICTALIGLQHRGQESSGIVMSDGIEKFNMHKGMGLVAQVFKDEFVMSKLNHNSSLGIGHTRYSTAGSSNMLNCQPFVVETLHGLIAVAHNGELVNANSLKRRILSSGTGLSTGSDSELITQLLSRPPPLGEQNGPDWTARLTELMKDTLTAYSLVVMHKDVVYAVRDPYGNRPLCLGKLMTVEGALISEHAANGHGDVLNGKKISTGSNDAVSEGWVVSSESCAFPSIGAKYYRDILPGEIVQITKSGVKSMTIVARPNNDPAAFCIFEYVYFSRADSEFQGQMVYAVRERCGRRLAMESYVDADLVSTVPESATPAAIGYSLQAGLPYLEVFCKNRYVGRTFIQPSTRLRRLNVMMKFGVVTPNVVGKRIILIDDSIVRGNTMKPIVQFLKDSGAREVHIRIASPPLKHPCYMGINIPTRDELIANQLNLVELAEYMGADSVVYLSLDGLLDSVRPRMTSSASSISFDIVEENHLPYSPETSAYESLSISESTPMSSTQRIVLPNHPAAGDPVPNHSATGDPSTSGPGCETPRSSSESMSPEHGHCTACLTGQYPVAIQW